MFCYSEAHAVAGVLQKPKSQTIGFHSPTLIHWTTLACICIDVCIHICINPMRGAGQCGVDSFWPGLAYAWKIVWHVFVFLLVFVCHVFVIMLVFVFKRVGQCGVDSFCPAFAYAWEIVFKALANLQTNEITETT